MTKIEVEENAFKLIEKKVQEGIAMGINEDLDPIESSTKIHSKLIEIYRILKYCKTRNELTSHNV